MTCRRAGSDLRNLIVEEPVHLICSRKQNDSLINSANKNAFLKLKYVGYYQCKYLSFSYIYKNSTVFHVMRDTE